MTTHSNYEVTEHDVEDIKARVRELLLAERRRGIERNAFAIGLAAISLVALCWGTGFAMGLFFR